MASYRVFYFDQRDCFFSMVDCVFSNDEQARTQVARVLPPGESGEVWCGTRCLGRIGPLNAPAAVGSRW